MNLAASHVFALTHTDATTIQLGTTAFAGTVFVTVAGINNDGVSQFAIFVTSHGQAEHRQVMGVLLQAVNGIDAPHFFTWFFRGVDRAGEQADYFLVRMRFVNLIGYRFFSPLAQLAQVLVKVLTFFMDHVQALHGAHNLFAGNACSTQADID